MFVELRKRKCGYMISQNLIDENFSKGKVTLVYGRPAQGKTTFAVSLTAYLNKTEEKASLYSLESNNLKTVEDIVGEVIQKHVKYVVIDYLQLMRTNSATKDKDDALALIIKKLIDLAEQTGTTVIVMSQLGKYDCLDYISYIEDVRSRLRVKLLEQLMQ